MDLGPWEIAIIAVVILVLFGSAKLPQAARSLGRSMRIFKSETKGLIGDDDDDRRGEPQDAREQAARLRAEAARLEAQSGRQLSPPSESDSAAPLRQTEHGKQS